jgi:putative transposase
MSGVIQMTPLLPGERFRRTDQMLTRLKACSEAMAVLRRARENGPAVIANNRGKENVITHVTAVKSGGRRIAIENMSLHDIARAWFEFDDDVLEWHYTPLVTDLLGVDDGDVLRSREKHAFQFLVVYKERLPILVDWRSPKYFTTLRDSKSSRFAEDPPSSGRWRDKAAEKFAKECGLGYALRSGAELPLNFVENQRFLADYRHLNTPLLSEDTKEGLRELVASRSRSMRELLSLGFTADVLFSAVVERALFVDLVASQLRKTDLLFFHAGEAQALIHREIREAELASYPVPLPVIGGVKRGDRVPYLGEVWSVSEIFDHEGLIERPGKAARLPIAELKRLAEVQLESEGRCDELRKRYKGYIGNLSQKQVDKAVARLKAARNGGGDGYSARSIRRFKAIVADNPDPIKRIIALAGPGSDQGRSASRFSNPMTEKLAIEVITSFFNTPECRNGLQAFQRYLLRCGEYSEKDRQEGEPLVKPMQYPAFMRRIHQFKDIRKRQGKRLAYQLADIPLRLDVGQPISGGWPHEVLYFDNTLLPAFTKGPVGESWKKCWLCAAVDGHTTRPVAGHMTYEDPSAQTVLMLLRIYIQREKRVPRVIVVDGGADFRSKALDDFCAFFGIDIRRRAGSMPRTGTAIENMFAVTDKQFISALEGNSRQLRVGARLNTKEVDPESRRTWEFAELTRATLNYLYEVRPKQVHPSFGMTISEFSAARMLETGYRDHASVELDENVMLLTSPYAPTPVHTVKPRVGVYANGEYYWHEDFSGMGGKTVTVRLEPWYGGVTYVDTGKKWVVALCRNKDLWGRTSYEVQQAIARKKQFAKILAQRDKVSEARAEMMSAATDRANFSNEIYAKQHVAKLLYFSEMKLGTALPMPEQILAAQPEVVASLHMASVEGNTGTPAQVASTATTVPSHSQAEKVQPDKSPSTVSRWQHASNADADLAILDVDCVEFVRSEEPNSPFI